LVERPELMQRHEVGRIKGRLRSLDTGKRVRLDTTRAKYLQERFRADHERLAERYLSPEHAAVLLAPPPEVPPYPPFDRDDLARRIMRLFNDPDLVHFALENAEQPSKRDTIPRDLITPSREEVAARTLRRFRYGKALERIVSLLPALSALVRRR
jgi:hypothetical protein